ncbi:4-hydroxy-tetrahydrodipicolinate synthase [Lachnospiraceae bacterium LCP19S3_B12]
MNKKVIFRGVGTAMVTPMKEDGAVNYPVFRELLEMQVENKADAVVIAGTTGEGSTLSDQEHIELVKFAVHEIRGRIPVIAGAGSNNTDHAVYLSRECERAGADALLHVTPYYNKASQQGLYLHFKACAEATSLPVILYNVPSRTGVNIYPATYKRLSEIDNITACKEASGNFSQLAKIASLCKDELTIYSGNDDQVTSALALGAQGVISVMSNILPAETHEICEAYFRGDSERSDSLQMKYLELIEALFMDVNPIPVKQAMRAMGYQVGGCRLPLCDMDPTNAERLYQVLKQYGLLRDGVRAGSVTVQRAKNAGHVIRSNV